DLLGNGTACLVWSSPLPGNTTQPMRYVNLMGGQKPHMLIKMKNNLGAETEIQYAPSTKFYLADKFAGTPWLTKLPFPVHVVEKVTVRDTWRQTSFSTTYSYHHGYFDGREREFRGFGRVDQIDVESYGEFTAGNTDSPYIDDDHMLYQPPVKTVTWFHTGAFFDREHILSHYQDEYFPNWFERLIPANTNVLGSFRENALPEPDIESHDLNPDEWRQAMRACKGIMLRQEIYELDVDALADSEERPVKLFSTAYHNCHIRRLQPQATNPHAVFLVTESEAITYHYELDLRPETLTPDPRIAHTLNLQVDDYGNVLQAVAVVYPRIERHEDTTLPPGAENLIAQVQTEMHLAYTETRYTNDVADPSDADNYRLRVPCEALTYELTGISPTDESDRESADPRDNLYFTLDELRRFRLSEVHQTEGTPVTGIPYHQIPNRSDPQQRIVEHVRMLYFHENLRDSLPLGQLNALGLPYETYKLALTDELLTAILDAKLTTDVRHDLDDETLSGYLSGADLDSRFPGRDNSGQYWIRSGVAGFALDAADHFYLPERYTDPFGNVTTIEFDRYDLFPQSSRDPVGNTTTVSQFDYRVLAPREMEDINGNLSEVAFDVLGLPTAMAVKGKVSEADTLDTFTDALLNPALETRIRFFEDDFDVTEARRLLGGATARHIYDFGEERHPDGSVTYGHRPAAAAAILRERHVAWELESGADSPLQVAFEYSDGGGNALVKKAQAEAETDGGPLRWIASGKTILNNKGKPVKQYEPYFSVDDLGRPDHRFEEPREVGVTPIMYYDAVGRVVRTELPDGSFSRVEFSPWHVTSYDPSDTVLEPGHDWYAQRTAPTASVAERRAARIAEKHAGHAGTPATVFLDSLGREVISVAHNRVPDDDPALRNVPLLDRPWHDEKYVTFTKLDTEGKPWWIRDARSNLVMQYITPPVPNNQATDPTSGFVPGYDIAGNLLFQHSMDAGDRWLINDAAGQPFYVWDQNERVLEDGSLTPLEGRRFHTVYDDLRRPLAQQLQINGGSPQVVERFGYGETHPEAEARNLRGQVYQHYDPSGLMTNQRFDFKGNLLAVQRRLAGVYDEPVIHWPENPPPSAFEEEIFTQNTEYDALNRMTRLYNWHQGEGSRVAVYEPRYNERGLLQGEDLVVGATKTATGYSAVRPAPESHPTERAPAIRAMSYDAKGQRERIDYGNDTTTTYQYDPETFRLTRLTTAHTTDGRVFQDLQYTYDPSGNITEIYDDAYEPVFFRNQEVEPRSRYTYDALYRLIEAEGREQYSAAGAPPQRPAAAPEVTFFIDRPNDPNALRDYTQRYTYDSVGNIMQMRHSANGDSWTRHYAYRPDNNRLWRTWMGSAGEAWPGTDLSQAVEYRYDTHGSMLNLNRAPAEYYLRWDYRDMIHTVNLGGGGQAYYNYDAGKQRTRKRIERNGSTVEERLYLGGMERYRRWRRNPTGDDTLLEEIETHHLFADDQRVLIVEDVLLTDSDNLGTGTLFKYQYSNHLGSVGLELDADAQIISYEEYHPYGTTAYSANNLAVRSTRKRYRYTGMERDEETGLSYHTARYYAPWLGRWGSADPVGLIDGTNLYSYTRNNPLVYIDSVGTQCNPTISSCPNSIREMLEQSSIPEEHSRPRVATPPPNPAESDRSIFVLRASDPRGEVLSGFSESLFEGATTDPGIVLEREINRVLRHGAAAYAADVRGDHAGSVRERLLLTPVIGSILETINQTGEELAQAILDQDDPRPEVRNRAIGRGAAVVGGVLLTLFHLRASAGRMGMAERGGRHRRDSEARSRRRPSEIDREGRRRGQEGEDPGAIVSPGGPRQEYSTIEEQATGQLDGVQSNQAQTLIGGASPNEIATTGRSETNWRAAHRPDAAAPRRSISVDLTEEE
ncbi:MAG: hypothetical protein GY788_29475, partial [bacterium]|nr:hypothetical protein [bacterium]